MNIALLQEQLARDGYLVLPDVLTPAEVAIYRAGVEKAFSEFCPEAETYHMQEIFRTKMFQRGQEFEALIDHPVIAPLIDAVLGDDCHLIANSALRTMPGKTITFWHADDVVRFPIPRGLKLDPGIPMPTLVLNAHYYLNDVDEELGPTQFIPGSHRSGRAPAEEDNGPDGNPVYEGKTMVSAVGKAGTCVIWHDQTWHRGGPNYSNNRTRLAIQTPFAKRFVAQRFWPFVNYHLPEDIIARATPRRKRLLGFHNIGAYG